MGRCSITPCLITYRRVNQIDGLTNWNGYIIPCIGKWRHVTCNSAFWITFLHVFFRNFWGSLQFMQDLLGYCVMESESNRYTGYTGHWIYIVAFVWLLRANGQHVHHSVFMMYGKEMPSTSINGDWILTFSLSNPIGSHPQTLPVWEIWVATHPEISNIARMTRFHLGFLK